MVTDLLDAELDKPQRKTVHHLDGTLEYSFKKSIWETQKNPLKKSRIQGPFL